MALIEEKGTVRFAIPIDERRMITIGIRQHEMLQRLVWREYGFERYLEYVSPGIEKDLAEKTLKKRR